MTNEFERKRWADIKMNNDFINIRTWSGYSMIFADISQKNVYLTKEESEVEIGRYIREALYLSRFVHPIENKELDLYLYNPDRYQEWLQITMEKFGYKTKSKLFKPMLSCSVILYNSIISIRPSHQDALDGWDRTGLTEADNVIIPETCTDEELGAAARLALSRCTSKFIDKDD